MQNRQPFSPQFPTTAHKQAAEAIGDFFAPQEGVDAVLLVNSAARGKATSDSDLDIAVLIKPQMPDAARTALESEWLTLYGAHTTFADLKRQGRFCRVHLDLFDGRYVPQEWDDGGGPDYFEVEIGNQVARSLPLWERGDAFALLKAQWLPYYDDALRGRRLTMVREACLYDLSHVPFFIGRGLYFAAFDRLYRSFQEMLQAVFIARRVYPIAYNKWIREQVEEWLGLPELYAILPGFLEIQRLESDEMLAKADALRTAVEQWTAED